MSDATVTKPSYSASEDRDFGPAKIEHRTAGLLSRLGTYFMVFKDDSYSLPWRLQYEETIYVIEGQLRIREGQKVTVADAGELLVLPKGVTVEYGGVVGTRVVLSITPANWREEV